MGIGHISAEWQCNQCGENFNRRPFCSVDIYSSAKRFRAACAEENVTCNTTEKTEHERRIIEASANIFRDSRESASCIFKSCFTNSRLISSNKCRTTGIPDRRVSESCTNIFFLSIRDFSVSICGKGEVADETTDSDRTTHYRKNPTRFIYIFFRPFACFRVNLVARISVEPLFQLQMCGHLLILL